MYIKLIEIFDYFFRNKKKCKIKYIILLNYLWFDDKMDIFKIVILFLSLFIYIVLWEMLWLFLGKI